MHRLVNRISCRAVLTLCLGVLTLLLTLIHPLVVWGQSSLLTKPGSPLNPVLTPTSSSTADLVTADVQLDGRKLFAIAGPTVRNQTSQNTEAPPLKERIEKIETTLHRIANSSFNPKTLQVRLDIDPKSSLPVISVNDSYLMTVTTLDAQLQGQDPERRATELTQTLKEALLSARQERQPDALARQTLLAGQILLSMGVASLVISLAQRRLKFQAEQIKARMAAVPEVPPNLEPGLPPPAMTAVQEQMNQRQRRNANDVQRRLLQAMQVGIWAIGSFVILGLYPYSRWLQSLVFSGPLRVLGIVLLTYVAIRVSDVLIDRLFSTGITEQFISPDTSQRLALRVSTFSRVLRSVVGFLCIGAGVLSVLSVIGVELGPVLAGAGILGLAISFASQNLIKDVINGLLILAEDQYAVGDVIQVGKATGFVESMNLRITQLRNAEGRLITIPNSSITVVENLSKDWSRVDLAITIAYDADADQAINVIRQVGDAMSRDLEWQSKIPEPPEVLGIDEIGNAGITIRIWIKTLPLQQWSVAREFRRRLKLALDEQGISIGVPQQSLWFHGATTVDKVLDEENSKADSKS